MLSLIAAVRPAPCAAPAGDAQADAEVRAALTHVLASGVFCKAQRMRRLLRFLVEKRLTGALCDTNEYAIGIDVFDRDPATYNTGEDPIVRVQVGRLRDKLKAYYGAAGQHALVRFSIPVGSYMPKIDLMNKVPPANGRRYLLAIAPLVFFSADPDGAAFTRGVNEELAYHLFKAFGQTIVSHTFDTLAHAGGAGVSHQLEGSVRVHCERLRTSIRLIDSAAGCIVWSEQFDQCAPFAIALQEELARAICAALEQHFALG